MFQTTQLLRTPLVALAGAALWWGPSALAAPAVKSQPKPSTAPKVGPAAATSRPTMVQVENAAKAALTGSKIVPVVTDYDGIYLVILTGAADKDGQEAYLDAVSQAVGHHKNAPARVINAMTAPKPDPTPPPRPVTRIWPLVYSSGGFGAGGSPDASYEALRGTLNAVYGKPAKDGGAATEVVRNAGNQWIIQADAESAAQIESILTQAFAPWPQVQLDLWSVELVGDQNQVSGCASAISGDVRLTRAKLARVHQLLLQVLQKEASDIATTKRNSDPPTTLYDHLAKAGFSSKPTEALSLTEALIILGVAEKRDDYLTKWQNLIKAEIGGDKPTGPDANGILREPTGGRIGAINAALNHLHMLPKRERKARAWDEARLENEKDILLTEWRRDELFPHLRALYSGPTGDALYSATANSVKDLTCKLTEYQRLSKATSEDHATGKVAEAQARDYAGAVKNLRLASNATDRLMQATVEAYADDMEDLYLRPLQERIQNTPWLRANGVNFAGRSRIVVTSRRDATLKPTMEMNADQTRPRPLGTDFLNALFPGSAGGTKTKKTTTKSGQDGNGPETTIEETTEETQDNTGLSGLPKLLSTLPPAQAALVGAALTNDVQPVYQKVAPGLDILVRPSVMPDASTARLQIDFNFTVNTTADTNNRTDVWAAQSPNALTGYHVVTDTDISGFDLFDVSSFTMRSTVPQAPYYIPILGRLPLLGPAFQFPRNNKDVHHESIVLVNPVIIPRTMGLFEVYHHNDTLGAPSPSTTSTTPIHQTSNPVR